MQWDATPNAGFSIAEPWLPVAENFRYENVENQRRDPASLFNLYRRLIALRRTRPSLSIGSYRPLMAGGDLLLYERAAEGDRVLVALNMGNAPVKAGFPSKELAGTLLLSSQLDREGERVEGGIDLRAHEGALIEVAANEASVYQVRRDPTS
jgi:alpha-glucosidase